MQTIVLGRAIGQPVRVFGGGRARYSGHNDVYTPKALVTPVQRRFVQ